MANISLETLSKLRCTVCSRYLSHFPIYSNSDGSLRCGRCDNSSENLSRNEIFESLVENTRFPCIYDTEGCKWFLIPSTMAEHEKFCSFKQISCIKSDCKYSGCRNTLQDHLIKEHNIQLLEKKKKNKFEFTLDTPREINLAVENFNQYFYLNMKIAYQQINIEVVPANIDDFDLDLKFTVTFFNANDTEIEKLECSLNQTYNIDTSEKKWQNNKTTVNGGVDVKRDEMIKQQEIKLNVNNVNYDILDYVKCSNCENYILPPIFQCISGHGICSNCKKEIKRCPLSDCKSRIYNTRNYSLERLLKDFNFPCPYQKFGCMFVDKTEETEKHLKNCLFLTQACPADKCEWKNSKLKLFSHVEEKHIVMQNSSSLRALLFVNKTQKLYAERFIITKCKSLFKFVYSVEGLRHCWSVQYLGDQEECKNYSFIIDLVDLSGSNQKLMMQEFCSPLVKEQSKFFEGKGYVYANQDQLLRLMSKSMNNAVNENKVISFHVHINKL